MAENISSSPPGELRHPGKRLNFSMPEWVAGSQIVTLFLIHVDTSEAPFDSSSGMRRRFISNIYLGASGAANTLNLSACLSRSGKSDILDIALNRRSLADVAPPPPPKRRRK